MYSCRKRCGIRRELSQKWWTQKTIKGFYWSLGYGDNVLIKKVNRSKQSWSPLLNHHAVVTWEVIRTSVPYLKIWVSNPCHILQSIGGREAGLLNHLCRNKFADVNKLKIEPCCRARGWLDLAFGLHLPARHLSDCWVTNQVSHLHVSTWVELVARRNPEPAKDREIRNLVASNLRKVTNVNWEAVSRVDLPLRRPCALQGGC